MFSELKTYCTRKREEEKGEGVVGDSGPPTGQAFNDPVQFARVALICWNNLETKLFEWRDFLCSFATKEQGASQPGRHPSRGTIQVGVGWSTDHPTNRPSSASKRAVHSVPLALYAANFAGCAHE